MFECATCPKVFSSEKQLKTHFYNVHQKTKEILKCEECGKHFTNKIKFNNHRLKVHTMQKFDVCGFDIAQTSLQRHKRESKESGDAESRKPWEHRSTAPRKILKN